MARFNYTILDAESDTIMPLLSMTLCYDDRSIEISGLVDSGAQINIMPYETGRKLGANWDKQPELGIVYGPQMKSEARQLFVRAEHPQLTNGITPIFLEFAWMRGESSMLFFGQQDFFMVFDVCFYRSSRVFEVNRKTTRLSSP